MTAAVTLAATLAAAGAVAWFGWPVFSRDARLIHDWIQRRGAPK